MTEVRPSAAKPKAKNSATAGIGQTEAPSIFVPTVEAPAAFREIAENNISQAKDAYEKVRSAAEEATSALENAYATATKSAADYGLKLIDAARTNTNAAFDFAGEIVGAKTVSEMIELSASHARKQFDNLAAQSRDLVTLAQMVAVNAAGPIKDGLTRVAKKVA